MLDLNQKNDLFTLLNQGAILITPNNRLSAYLLQEYSTYHQNTPISKPSCMPFGSFLIRTYESLCFLDPHNHHPILINEAQSRHLWQEVIKKESSFTHSEGLLRALMQAYEYCELWHIDPEHPAFDHIAQTKKFAQLRAKFNKKMQELQLINGSGLIPYLTKNQTNAIQKPIIWGCFDDFNPQQKSLQQHLSQQGLLQYQYDLPSVPHTTALFAAQDSEEEYHQLIAWLDSRLDCGDKRIGVVVPNLEQESSALQRMMSGYFEPHLFDFTLGQKLGDYSIVAHALCWLHFDSLCISHQQAVFLFQSPFLSCTREDFLALSEYLQDSTLINQESIPLRVLIEELKTVAPLLSTQLNTLKPYPKTASIVQWVYLFQERLDHLGFPGEEGLDSINYQCYKRFKEIFNELLQLSLIHPDFNTQEALDTLSSLTQYTIFQAQKKNPIIQISGLLEASGCEFDSLWVCGLTSQCLPEKTSLSAFIPLQLQRDLLMPHSTPARELLFAKKTLNRLQAGSSHTVFSYPQFYQDSPCLPCSLIEDLPPFTPFPLTLNQKALASFALEEIEESYHIPLQTEERIAGGTSLLANQAKCPFKAFAEHRLKASASLSLEELLNNKAKGQILHKVMELIWSRLGSQKELLKLNTADLDILVEEVIQSTLAFFFELEKETLPNLILELEHNRLKNLVKANLDWEKTRPSFVVLSLEESFTINLAGLDFKVRIDRMDQVGNKKWVIDYKSTLPTSKPWKEDRPKEPQLLLYALLDEQINTLVFLQLKTGAFECQGLSEDLQDLEGLHSLDEKHSWEQVRAQWQEQLSLLAQEFQTGYSAPKPLSSSICQQCDFQSLCRFS